MRFLVWSTWDYLSSWFHCCWPSQTYCFVEFMVCFKSTSKSQQKCGIVWLGSKLLTDIIKYVFEICEDFFKMNYMICKWWELNKCCWQTDKIHSPPAWVFVTRFNLFSEEKSSVFASILELGSLQNGCERTDCLLLAWHSSTQEAQTVVPEVALTFSDWNNLIVRLINTLQTFSGMTAEMEGSAHILH